jgi:hypothetical protein
MNARDTVRDLLLTRRTAALATLHHGQPAISMVPFAPFAGGVVIHVSGLASHTGDMSASPGVSFLVAGDEDAHPPLSLPRIAVRATAIPLDGPESDAARDAYLARFPDAAPIFGLGDFSMFLLRPDSARVVAGFGAATTISAEDFAAATKGGHR